MWVIKGRMRWEEEYEDCYSFDAQGAWNFCTRCGKDYGSIWPHGYELKRA
jgi:hypothetical protein